jgi:hypothetical protein
MWERPVLGLGKRSPFVARRALPVLSRRTGGFDTSSFRGLASNVTSFANYG